MIANSFVIKGSDIEGKGVFAKQFVPKGTIAYFDCESCKPWTKKALAKLSKNELNFVMEHDYPIKYCSKELLYNNHSCNANVMDIGNRVSIVVRDIKKGEEQVEDYRIYCYGDVHFKDGCRCGKPNCMRKKVFERPAAKELQEFWNRKINGAMRLISTVSQPLKRQVLRKHPELIKFFKKDGNHLKQKRILAKLERLRARGPGELKGGLKNVFGLTEKGFSYVG